MNVTDYISVDPRVCHGQPCFKGTRIMAYLVLELLEADETPEQILRSYPSLTLDHIHAALHVAAELIKHEEFTPFHTPA